MIGQLRAFLPLSSTACRAGVAAGTAGLLQPALQQLQPAATRAYAQGREGDDGFNTKGVADKQPEAASASKQDGVPQQGGYTTTYAQGWSPKVKDHRYTNPQEGEPLEPATKPVVVDHGVEREIPEAHKRGAGVEGPGAGVKGGQNPVSTEKLTETPDKPKTA